MILQPFGRPLREILKIFLFNTVLGHSDSASYRGFLRKVASTRFYLNRKSQLLLNLIVLSGVLASTSNIKTTNTVWKELKVLNLYIFHKLSTITKLYIFCPNPHPCLSLRITSLWPAEIFFFQVRFVVEEEFH